MGPPRASSRHEVADLTVWEITFSAGCVDLSSVLFYNFWLTPNVTPLPALPARLRLESSYLHRRLSSGVVEIHMRTRRSNQHRVPTMTANIPLSVNPRKQTKSKVSTPSDVLRQHRQEKHMYHRYVSVWSFLLC